MDRFGKKIIFWITVIALGKFASLFFLSILFG